ncbi:MAG: alpha/beta hydrolase [Acidimicrobiia bacterium]|nr:alpha/beta hydrolase [Acidimicrobiia bacterium]
MPPLKLSLRTWGSGPKQALLIHGMSSNAAGWWRVGPALAERGYTVTTPDLRGHGRSPADADYSLAAYTADILELGDRWDLILGHSLGGAVAVCALIARPDLAPALVLEDPAVAIPDPDLAIRDLLASYVPPISPEEVGRRNPTWHQEDCRIKAAAVIESRPVMVEETIRQNTPWNLVEQVAALPVPTLLLGADIEPVVPAGFGNDLAAMSPNLRFEHIPGSSHSMHRDEFEVFLNRVGAFLDQQA